MQQTRDGRSYLYNICITYSRTKIAHDLKKYPEKAAFIIQKRTTTKLHDGLNSVYVYTHSYEKHLRARITK